MGTKSVSKPSKNGTPSVDDYQAFLRAKDHPDTQYGFEHVFLPDCLFPFQKTLVDWSVRKGRAALFTDCGTGKGIMALAFCENIVRKENKPVLLLTPLAVGPQLVREGDKFGIPCKQTQNGKVFKGINVTNYERLNNYNPDDFAGVVCDESGILKSLDGKLRRQVTDFLSKVKYRLLASATPAPNDYMELGSSSEALGMMGRHQMLGMFFTNGGESTQQWELKGHARKRFWRWMCSWARALRKPSDLGEQYSDKGFVLPKLTTENHVVASKSSRNGFFGNSRHTLHDERADRRATIQERCRKVADLVAGDDYAVIWCHLNAEGDLLEKLIPGAVQVAGSYPLKVKEERLAAFAMGNTRVLICKAKIGGFGLNLQHCNHVVTFTTHSWESYYQTIRRCWRFGQKRPVKVDVVMSEAESHVLANMSRKERQMDQLFSQLVAEMREYQVGKKAEETGQLMELPEWLTK